MAEGSVGSAFRNRGDSIAAGNLLSQGRSEQIRRRGLAWSVGQRKLSKVKEYADESEESGDSGNSENSGDQEEDSEGWTDWESDDGEEVAEQEQVLRLLHEQAQAQLLPFYQRPFNNAFLPEKRQAMIPERSELMLLRHLPLRSPCDHIQLTMPEDTSRFDEAAPLKRKQEGASSKTPDKRAKPATSSVYSPMTFSQASKHSTSSLEPKDHSGSSFDSTGLRETWNRFGAKAVTKPLSSRSSLSAFQKKRL